MKTKISFEKQLLSLQDNMFNFALTLTADREEAKDLLQEKRFVYWITGKNIMKM